MSRKNYVPWLLPQSFDSFMFVTLIDAVVVLCD